jgi:glycopeptide antibiotics resistance protein
VNSERPRVARASIVSTAQARLSRAVLGYLALMIAIITLAPFRFAASPVRGFVTMWGLRDAVLNVVLFLPLGFVLQLGRPRGSPFAWGRALALGATFSGLIEVAQLFLPERFPSLADLATNALGAVLGALLAARATRRLDAAGTVRAFALDLPLVGLLYLFVPVLWLGGLSFDGRELLLLLLPVVSAGWIIASVHAAYSGSAHTARIRPLLQPALGGALFVAIGFLPAMPVAPMLAPAAAAVLALAVLARLRAPDSLTHERTASGGRSRRFEAPTLRAAMMPLLALIVGHALWPLDAPRAAWHGTLALLPFGVEPDDRGGLPHHGAGVGLRRPRLRGRRAGGTYAHVARRARPTRTPRERPARGATRGRARAAGRDSESRARGRVQHRRSALRRMALRAPARQRACPARP